ncbi:unnamed protein product [Ceutorhynchus assimilis]|uniref:Uncharacterized protein n=1 Tax=Ceutorhynchus assimilis TaxID=467358 RepID=A0A9N9MW73_9CUCU|nr:unnamed protein product [Ceutorhynchus assimilis]
MNPKFALKCLRAFNPGRRTLSGTPVPGHNIIKNTQKKFTQDDGLPVHLKAGSRDRLMYNGCWLAIILMDLWGAKVIIWDASLVPWLATF